MGLEQVSLPASDPLIDEVRALRRTVGRELFPEGAVSHPDPLIDEVRGLKGRTAQQT